MLATTSGSGRGDAVSDRAVVCPACHGRSGQSQQQDIPSLGGQPSLYTMFQLFLFREGRRQAGPMTEIAKDFTDDDLRGLSDLVSKLPVPKPPPDAADPQRFARGRALADQNHCGICHNADFSGRDQMPRLAAQREDYLTKTLREFKTGARIGFRGAMAEEVTPLSDSDIVDLAHFLAHLPAGDR
jgi:cytochrome c553